MINKIKKNMNAERELGQKKFKNMGKMKKRIYSFETE